MKSRDLPIAIPTRRPSVSRPSLPNTLAKLLVESSSIKTTTYPELTYSSQSSLKCLGSSSYHKNYPCHMDALMRTGGTRSKVLLGVWFASTRETTIVMNIDDYSSEEIESCWYTPNELQRRREDKGEQQEQGEKNQGERKKRRRPKKKRFDCKVCNKLLRGNSRWKA